MTDIIVIEREQFIVSRKLYEKNSALWTKYENIFKTYTCFNANIIITPKNSYLVKPNNKHIQRIETSRRVCREKVIKDIDRTLMSIMNILNERNYNKMLSRIRIIKDEENIQKIVILIFKMCSHQLIYIDLYIKLLNDIKDYSSTTELYIINNTINEYCSNFIKNREWVIETPVNNYDWFCDYQKLKIKVLALNIIIFKLSKMFDIDIDINTYISTLMSDLKNTNDDTIMLILELLLYNRKNNNMDIDNLDDIPITNKKIEFMLEDLKR